MYGFIIIRVSGDFIASSKSSGEFIIKSFLERNSIKYESQKGFRYCRYINSLPFDFYLPDYNICIEYQGEQHYKPASNWHGHLLTNEEAILEFKDRAHKDQIKKNFCYENDIILLEPRFDMKKKEIENLLEEALGLRK